MRGLITTLNSKFTHSALSIRYLQKCIQKSGREIELKEYTINHRHEYILSEIYKEKYDFIGFSCYIWNFNQIIDLCRNLKKLSPNLKIALGGPEVSYDPVEIMKMYPFIDFISVGEGELSFTELYSNIYDGTEDFESVKGIVHRKEEQVVENTPQGLIEDLDIIPFPYDDQLTDLDNRIIYYESSRGCPFNCQYCLSSTIKGVRMFSLERVKKDLQFFLDRKVMQVKFVDRTFNANKKHSFEILKYLYENNNGVTNFHFEITASLLDEEMLEFLKDMPEGLFQFEVGVQSTNDETIEAIDRKVAFERVAEHCLRISSYHNIHLHLDLIVGLPHENLESFKKSFNDVYYLKPEKLQLGFLKLLKGSGLRVNEDEFGYVYNNLAPYEIFYNKYITFDEVLLLKEVEELVESYYNGHRFDHSIEFLIKKHFDDNPIEFYMDFVEYWESAGLHHVSHKSNALYGILMEYYENRGYEGNQVFRQIVKYDYYKNNSKKSFNLFEEWEIEDFSNRCHQFLKDEENVDKYLPVFKGVPAKNIIKQVHFEAFKMDIEKFIDSGYEEISEETSIMLFDYKLDRKVFARSKNYKVEI